VRSPQIAEPSRVKFAHAVLPWTRGCVWMLAGRGRSADAHLSDHGPHAHAGLLHGRPHQAGNEFASGTVRDERQVAARTKSKLQYIDAFAARCPAMIPGSPLVPFGWEGCPRHRPPRKTSPEGWRVARISNRACLRPLGALGQATMEPVTLGTAGTGLRMIWEGIRWLWHSRQAPWTTINLAATMLSYIVAREEP
jgi:hypothetical protein